MSPSKCCVSTAFIILGGLIISAFLVYHSQFYYTEIGTCTVLEYTKQHQDVYQGRGIDHDQYRILFRVSILSDHFNVSSAAAVTGSTSFGWEDDEKDADKQQIKYPIGTNHECVFSSKGIPQYDPNEMGPNDYVMLDSDIHIFAQNGNTTIAIGLSFLITGILCLVLPFVYKKIKQGRRVGYAVI